MCAVVLVPFIRRASVTLPLVTAVAALAVALICTFLSFGDLDGVGRLLFGPGDSEEAGMLAVDLLSQLFKVLLLFFTLLILVQWWMTSRDETITHRATHVSQTYETDNFAVLAHVCSSPETADNTWPSP